jgi:hypothetical protein
MKELIESLVKNLKVDSRQAEGGAAILFKAARDKMGADEFSKLLGKVGGVDQLIAKAPDSGGLGKLFGGLASAVGGGNAAIVANILSGFGKLGLNQEHAKSFVPVMMDFLRTKVGKDAVDKIEKTLRA